jgi:oligosaccharide reducing-end xylanase
MRHTDGIYAGYFAWSSNLDGTHRAEGPAPDGEEYFAMALFFASHRWGDREALFDYSAQACDILRHCVHQKELTGGAGEPMFDPENHLIRFVPESLWTDPSYHLPHFYALFARWADEVDRPFWQAAADASRAYLSKVAHPVTGLSPEYSEYDGTPKKARWGGDSFYSDAYRVAINLALDTLWFGTRAEYRTIGTHLQNFFASVGCDNTKFMDYEIDGTPKERPALHPVGLGATIAAASLTSESDSRENWVRLFWDTPLRTDARRYFDSDLCFFTLLLLSGHYRIW